MSYERRTLIETQRATAETLTGEAIEAWLESSAASGATYVGLPQVPIPAGIGFAILHWCLLYPIETPDGPRFIDPYVVAAQVRHESASCQSRIARDKRNYSGYGAENDDPYGKAYTFATPFDGIGMQVRHLLGYVAGDGPWNATHEQAPRYHDIVKPKKWGGTVNRLHELEQRWAYTDPAKYAATPLEGRYGAKLAEAANDLVEFVATFGGPPMPTGTGLIPGVPFIAADDRHYTKGRTVTWPDEWIFHHSNGWDSLGWLTTSPNSNVSSTLLLWHDGTTRAQLVRLGDTPHTTGVYNPRSLSSEWERKWPEQKDISDTQYANIADSITRALLAEKARGNPFWQGIPPRSQFSDHNDYYDTACPGNLSVDRLYELIVIRLADAMTPPDDQGNPWFLHLGDGVMAPFAFRRGFRGVVEGLAVSRFPDDPNSAALALVREPLEEEWTGVDGHAYQRCKNVTLHYIPGNVTPWDVIFERADMPLPERKPA